MKTIIRYELKKIFQNKLFIGAFIICFVAMIAISAVAVYQYNTGVRGSFDMEYLENGKPTEVFVSNDTIDELRKAVEDFEERDDIYYESHEERLSDYADGGTVFFGKYDINTSDIFFKLEKGEITEEEFEALMSNTPKTSIKKQYFPEYIKLCWGVEEYENIERAIEREEFYASSNDETQYYRDYNAFLAKQHREILEKGFVSGYDYGWENFYSILSQDVGIFLAIIIIFGLCNVFTLEYSLSVDAFLLSSKKGRGTLAGGKIIAALIYTVICFVVYALLALIISFIFLGAEGMNVGQGESHLTKLLTVIPFILVGCISLCFITLAVSAFCKKQITSIAVSSLVCLLPFLTEFIIYIDNQYISQLLEVMPINTVFGTYIYSSRYVYLDGNFIDMRYFFPFVALAVMIVCLPLIYKKYTSHQVSN
ncbi:MAG: ABC transporter permease subunit [Clostridia bacterium]|nr:ABC transporter permease subunit [Clostridia bacterium]